MHLAGSLSGAGESKICSTTQTQNVPIAEKNAAISFSDKDPVPISPILRQIFGIDQGVDFVGLIVLVDDCIYSDMSFRNVEVVEHILTGW